MRGKDIPLVTWHRITKNGTESFKRPKYTLLPAADVRAKQDALGNNAGWYYGTWCKRCCGVWPAFFTDDGFENLCYYVCLVCGKESEHESMPHLARDKWNAGRYKWAPDEYRQFTIFDFLEKEVTE